MEELHEVKVLKQTDYTAYYEKVESEMFTLRERVAAA